MLTLLRYFLLMVSLTCVRLRNNRQVAMSPPTPGSVADAIGLGGGGEVSGGGRGDGSGGGNDGGGKGSVSGYGVSAEDYGETDEGDGGRLICRRVLCRWVKAPRTIYHLTCDSTSLHDQADDG